MKTQTLNAMVAATERYMSSPEGTSLLLWSFSRDLSPQGAIILCVGKATGLEKLEVAEEVAAEIIRQETAKAVGYMKIGA